MSEAREQILNSIRRNLKRGPLDGDHRSKLDQRLADHPRNPIPSRALLPSEQRTELFVTMAEEAAAEVQRVESAEQVPQAIAAYLDAEGLGNRLVMAPDEGLARLPWNTTRLEIQRRKAENGDKITVTGAFAGIAETGTLMLLSGPHSPTTLNLLPDVHIVVLSHQSIVGPYEDAWQKLRERGKGIPRTVNMITGPSRSADIEQTLQLGAHGPIRLHIVLVMGPLDAGRG